MTATREPRPAPLEAPLEPPRDEADDGADRLAVEASRLRSRRSVPVDRWFQLAGAALLGVGFLAIIAGWYGVSHTAREWRQMPYVLSGGLLGLGLVVTGAVAYLAYWLTKLVEQTHRQTAVLERLELALVGAPAVEGDLVVAAGVLHRTGCPLLLGKADVHPATAADEQLRRCPVCEPPAD